MPACRTSLFLLLASTLAFAAAPDSKPLVVQTAPVLITQPVDNSLRTVLKGNVHPLARADFDRGEAPAAMPLHRLLLVLKRSDQQESALRRLIENQQYKNSPSYHQWLTPQQFGAQFGPSDSDIAAVVNWLKVAGFSVTQVSNGRTAIEFDGTAGLVKQAFGTAIHHYVINGEEHWANSSNPSIPTALAPVVAGVNSLHDFRKAAQHNFVGTYSEKAKRLTSPVPHFTFSFQGTTVYAVAPYDFATIYNLLPLWTAAPPLNGAGQTIAIVARTDIDPTDATDFWNLFGLDGVNAPRPTLTITHNGPAPGVNADEAEGAIDVQWSGAAAPGATINFVTSESTETTDGVDLSALYIVDNNLAPVMSESYGQCETSMGTADVAFFGGLWEEAAAQGISVFVSTGDNGAAGCDNPNTATAAQLGLNVNGIASTPWNAAVGGTDFAQFTTNPSNYWSSTNAPITQESALGYIPETTWNDSCANPLFQFVQGGTTDPEVNCNNSSFSNFLDIVGGSGGKSLAWPKPAWQTGTGVPNDNARDLPDISLFSSDGFLGSFYVLCLKDATGGVCDLNNIGAFGGTSIASPAFAGIMALVNQKWGPQGVPGLILYNLISKQSNAFHDIPSGSTIAMPCVKNSTDCTTHTSSHTYGVLNGYSTTAGYDLATGLGSVNAANLVNNWNKATFTPSTTTLTVNNGTPVNLTHGAAVPVTISVSPSAATGDVALLVAPGTPGNPGIDFNTLATGGTVTWNTNLLPGGTYQVVAHYAGDKTYGGSYSTPSANVTVNPENSSVYMPGVVTPTGYANSVVYGTGAGYSYLLRADVKNSQGKVCTTPSQGEIACPTGTINFTDNGSALDGGAFSLNSQGYTEDQNIELTGGSHTLVASYGGDASYNASSNSPGVTITVTTGPTSLSNVSAPPGAAPGSGFNVSATVATTSHGVAPTGTVSFLANGSPLSGTVQYSPQAGSPSAPSFAALGASLNTSIAAPGNYNITATYSGDTNYASAPTSNSVSMGIFDFALGAISDPPAVNPGQSTSTTLMVSPVGAATFTDNVTLSCTGLTGVTCTFSPTIMAGSSATSVTVTVQTAGPFTGSASGARGVRQHAPTQRSRLWLPLGLPLTGLLLVGVVGRTVPRSYKIAGFGLVLVLAGLLVACGGHSSPPPIIVTVSPNPVNTLWPNFGLTGEPAQTATLTASVANTTNQAVTWSISPNNAASGSVQSTGTNTATYTAPTAVPPGPVIVTATAQADSTSSGSTTVNIQTPTPAGMSTVTVGVAEGGVVKNTSFNLTVN